MATIAASQGRRCTAWLQRAAGDSPTPLVTILRLRPSSGIRSRSTLGPRYASSAGSSEIDAAITTRTASAVEIATPYM